MIITAGGRGDSVMKTGNNRIYYIIMIVLGIAAYVITFL